MRPDKRTPVSARLISLLLAIVLVVTLVPALAFANGGEEPVAPVANEIDEGGEAGEEQSAEPESSDLPEVIEESGEPSHPESSELGVLDAGTEVLPLDEDLGTLGVADDFSMIDTVVSPASFQTFNDLQNNTTPTQLTVTVQVQPTSTYVEDGVVKLPLDYNPVDQGLTNFTYGTDGTNGVGNAGGNPVPDFFSLDEVALAASIAQAASIVKSYTIEDDVLVLKLKSAAEYTAGTIVGLKSIQLAFDFNTDYNMKVPVSTVMWQPEPEISLEGSTDTLIAAAKTVTTSATREITYGSSRLNPSDTTYLGGALVTRFSYLNQYYYQSDFDPTYTNRIWIEFPAGTTINSNITSLFPNGTSLDHNGSGYDRYYKNVSNTSSSWNVWHYSGNPYNTFHQLDISYIVPNTIVDGDSFEVRTGADYRKINGEIKQTQGSLSYTKQARNVWQFYLNSAHATGGTMTSVCGIENNNTAQTSLATGWSSFTHSRTSKNLGTESITGVSYELYQASTSSSKVNFSSITLYAGRDAGDSSDIPDWTQYRYEFDVFDTSTGISTTVAGASAVPTNSGSSQTFALALPALTTTQYINVVRIIPMGTDGSSEGELTSRNGFGVGYVAKAWNNKIWPDGTTVPSTNTSVPMAWRMHYDNNPEKPGAYPSSGGVPATFQGGTAYVYYSSQPYAQANLVSSAAAAGVNSGSTVSYTLYGYNDSNYTVGTWNNPQVIVRVPEVMTLVDVSGAKTLTDVLSNTPYTANAALIGSAGGYNYYSFTATGYNAPERAGTVPVFSIPLQFEIASTATPQTYAAPRVVVTTTTPSTFWRSMGSSMNGSLGESRSLYGLNDGDNYSISTSPASSALKVLSSPRLDVNSAVQSSATGGLYVTSELVPAIHGETTQMKLVVYNGGNVAFTSIRLYDILPYNLDALGSSGSVGFNSLSIMGATSPTIYYTSDAVSSLAPYGLHGAEASGPAGVADLQASTFQTAWAAGSPGAGTTAFFLDFGAQVLAAGDSIEIVLNFDIPATGDQTAYNQFRYSAQEVGSTAAPLNQNAPKQGFSTATIGIIYHGDDSLPALYAPGGALDGASDLADVPTAATSSFIITGQTLAVDVKSPTLTGYTFKGWDTSSTATTVVYNPGAIITFSAAGTVNLYPVWELNSYRVSYGYTGTIPSGAPGLPTTETKNFSDLVTQALAPSLTNYTFSGWATTSAGVNLTGGQFSMPDNAVVFEGSWTRNEHLVTYAYTGTVPVSAPGAPASATVPAGTNNVLVEANPVLAGYDFSGWESSDATVAGGSFTMPDKPVAFSGAWAPHTNTAWKVEHYKVDSGGNATLADTDLLSGTTDTEADATAQIKTFTGYTYQAGYNNGSNAEILKGTINGEGTLVLKLYYTANAYTVFYHGNGGTGTVAQQTVYYDEPFTTQANGYLLSGYTFRHWNTAQNGSGVSYGASTSYTYATAGDTTLYAVWDANTGTAYRVEHYLVGTSGTPTLDFTEHRSGTTDTTASASARNYAPAYYHNAGYAGTVASANIKGDGSTVLRLFYSLNYYTVTFVDWNDSTLASRSVPYGGSALAPLDPVRIGYTFTGWDRDYTNVTSNITVRALYTPLTFTVTFLGYNDVVLQTSTVNYGGSTSPPASPTRTGYRFTGWDSSSNAWTNVTADATIRAMWNGETITTTPITTETTTGGGTTSPDGLAEVAETQGIPTIGVPLAAPQGFAAWALANLILAVLGVVATLIFGIVRFVRKKSTEEDEQEERRRLREEQAQEYGYAANREDEEKEDVAYRRRRSIGWFVGAILFALVGVVLFILTQDITLPMVWVDFWTIFNLVLFAGALITGALAIGRKKKTVEEEEADEEQTGTAPGTR